MNQTLDMSTRRAKLADRKIAETANEAVVEGMDPFLCVIILQTYSTLEVQIMPGLLKRRPIKLHATIQSTVFELRVMVRIQSRAEPPKLREIALYVRDLIASNFEKPALIARDRRIVSYDAQVKVVPVKRRSET